MNSKLMKIDEYIDNMDTENILDKIEELEFKEVIEDSEVFARKVLSSHKKNKIMNKKILLTIAASFLIITYIPYSNADILFKTFHIFKNNEHIQVRTSQNIKDVSLDFKNNSKVNKASDKLLNFNSLDDALNKFEMPINFLNKIPSNFKIEKDIYMQETFSKNYNLYFSYIDKDKHKRINIVATSMNLKEDETVISKTKDNYIEKINSNSNEAFYIFKDSKNYYALFSIDRVDYLINFSGFSLKDTKNFIKQL